MREMRYVCLRCDEERDARQLEQSRRESEETRRRPNRVLQLASLAAIFIGLSLLLVPYAGQYSGRYFPPGPLTGLLLEYGWRLVPDVILEWERWLVQLLDPILLPLANIPGGDIVWTAEAVGLDVVMIGGGLLIIVANIRNWMHSAGFRGTALDSLSSADRRKYWLAAAPGVLVIVAAGIAAIAAFVIFGLVVLVLMLMGAGGFGQSSARNDVRQGVKDAVRDIRGHY